MSDKTRQRSDAEKIRRRDYKKTRRLVECAAIFQQGRCAFCFTYIDDFDDLTADHLIPLSQGGRTNETNIVMACGPCNWAKEDRSVVDFMRGRTIYPSLYTLLLHRNTELLQAIIAVARPLGTRRSRRRRHRDWIA